jgi:hypothetical protein
MPDDLIKIYRTLEILAMKSQRSFAAFIAAAIQDEDDYTHGIRRLATVMDQLTYSAARASAERFEDSLDEAAVEAARFQMSSQNEPDLFGRKRLWCSLRDYLKSPEFNRVFVGSLKKTTLMNPERWERDNPELKIALSAIELPGDVWNNAEVFREGLFSPYLANERSSWDMPRTIRSVYELLSKEGPMQFYPEQLDVSFDFVPKMCEEKMCDVCLFGEGIEDLCHQRSGCFCPITLISCGYRFKCCPNKCYFKENRVKNLCKKRRDVKDAL